MALSQCISVIYIREIVIFSPCKSVTVISVSFVSMYTSFHISVSLRNLEITLQYTMCVYKNHTYLCNTFYPINAAYNEKSIKQYNWVLLVIWLVTFKMLLKPCHFVYMRYVSNTQHIRNVTLRLPYVRGPGCSHLF